MKITGKLDSRSGIYEIQPGEAQQLLETPGAKNRPIKNGVILRYARRMDRGLWRLTGEPIILDKDGNLLDGEHRLRSCIVTGKPFTTVVLYGAFDFFSMNQGSLRGGGDALDLAIPNLKNRLGVSAAASLCMKHERALSREASMYSQSHQTSKPKDHWTDLDNYEIVGWVKKHTEIIDLYAKAVSLAKPGNAPALLPLSPCTAGWFLARTVANGAADPWFEGLLSGAGLDRGDVRLLLRQTIQNRLAGGDPRPAGVEALHWVAKAWRDRGNKSARIFGVKRTEDFPFFR